MNSEIHELILSSYALYAQSLNDIINKHSKPTVETIKIELREIVSKLSQ